MDKIENILADFALATSEFQARLENWKKTFSHPAEGIREDPLGALAVAVYNEILLGNIDRAHALLYKFKEPEERIKKVEQKFEQVRDLWIHQDELANRRIERREGLPKGSLRGNTFDEKADALRRRLYEEEFGKVEATKILKQRAVNSKL